MNYLTLDPQIENVISDCVTALFDECIRKMATRLRVEASSAKHCDDEGNITDYGDWVLEFKQVRKPVRPLPGQLALPFDGDLSECSEASAG